MATRPYRVRWQYPGQPEYGDAYETIRSAVTAVARWREAGATARLGVPDGRKFRELTDDEARAALAAADCSDLARCLDSTTAED